MPFLLSSSFPPTPAAEQKGIISHIRKPPPRHNSNLPRSDCTTLFFRRYFLLHFVLNATGNEIWGWLLGVGEFRTETRSGGGGRGGGLRLFVRVEEYSVCPPRPSIPPRGRLPYFATIVEGGENRRQKCQVLLLLRILVRRRESVLLRPSIRQSKTPTDRRSPSITDFLALLHRAERQFSGFGERKRGKKGEGGGKP